MDGVFLPPNTGGDGFLEQDILPDRPFGGGDQLLWTVPSGELWMPVIVTAGCDTGAAVGNRVWLLHVISSGSNTPLDLDVGGPAAFGASISCFISYGRGLASSSAPDSNANIWQTQALPSFVLQPGWQLQLRIRGSFGGDIVPGAFTGNPSVTVVKFGFGSGGAASQAQELIGPFMLVPGPGTVPV